MSYTNHYFLKHKLLFFNLTMLLTAFSPFIGEANQNFLLMGVLVFSVIITSGQMLKPFKNSKVIFLFPITLVISSIYLGDFNPLSYLYSLSFILFFISNLYLIRTINIKISNYLTFIKSIIYCYFVVLIIQQSMYILGLDELFNGISTEGFKFNILHTEPSYAVTVIVLLLYSYVSVKEIQNNYLYKFSNFKVDIKIWLACTYIILTAGSSIGILLFILLLFSFIKSIKRIFFLFNLSLLIYFIGLYYEFTPFVRLNDVLLSFVNLNGNYDNIIEADHSASVRIIPFLMAISSLEFYSLLGMGVDFSANYFPTVIPGINEGSYNGGLIPSFIIDHGLLNLIVLFFVIKKFVISNFISFPIILLFIVSLNSSLNTQLFWSVMTVLSMNKHYKNIFLNPKI